MAFSDLHLSRSSAKTLVEASADADLVLGAGDFCNHRMGLSEAMALLSGIKRPTIVVPGNAESADELRHAALPGTTVLHGSGTQIDGLYIFGLGYGIPPTPFGSWSCDMTETDADAMLQDCDFADILLFHSPPKGIGDRTSNGLSVGSVAVRDAIVRVQPKLAVCGHIHDSWGATGEIGETHIANLGPRPNWFKISPN